MAKPKAEKTQVQIAAEKAREHHKAAKEKADKAPNNEALKKAANEAQTKLREAIAAENRERFVRVGSVRVNKAIKSMQTLRQIANPRTYKFNAEDIEKAMGALKAEYDATVQAFENALKGSTKDTGATGFTFE